MLKLKQYTCFRFILEEALRFTLISFLPRHEISAENTIKAEIAALERTTKSRLRSPEPFWLLVVSCFVDFWIPCLYCGLMCPHCGFIVFFLVLPGLLWFLTQQRMRSGQHHHNTMTARVIKSDKQQEQQQQQQNKTKQNKTTTATQRGTRKKNAKKKKKNAKCRKHRDGKTTKDNQHYTNVTPPAAPPHQHVWIQKYFHKTLIHEWKRCEYMQIHEHTSQDLNGNTTATTNILRKMPLISSHNIKRQNQEHTCSPIVLQKLAFQTWKCYNMCNRRF